MRALKNTLSVLIVTTLTAVTLYGGIQAVGASQATAGTTTSSASAAAGQTYMCPATGCTSSTCHATSGAAAQAGASTSYDSASSSGSGTMTCPRTGCTASSCHHSMH